MNKSESNRRNAKRSTGPRTQTGKAASSANALKHGLLSRKPVLPWENPDECVDFMKRMIKLLNPSNYVEYQGVLGLALNLWKLRRAGIAHVRLLLPDGGQCAEFYDIPDELERLARYETTLWRMINQQARFLKLLRPGWKVLGSLSEVVYQSMLNDKIETARGAAELDRAKEIQPTAAPDPKSEPQE